MIKKPAKDPKNAASDKLSKDEEVLWMKVAETVTPIDASGRGQDRVRISVADDDMGDNRLRPRSPSQTSKKTTVHKSLGAMPNNSPVVKTPPKPTGLGQAHVRKLRSGRISIEARLDLHGMRQSEAHVALRQFISASHQRGLRWVLVITGKGGRGIRQADDNDSRGPFDGRSEPGVLRRTVPSWLQEQDLRAMVIGFQTASPQHGGDGALYVNLRRSDRAKKY
ncbi:MAG: Smr/MutS family protein [Alphaproteobacteria bacterium]|nr:Smr/MutS family protein [Alphaproteobacteria bacterium]